MVKRRRGFIVAFLSALAAIACRDNVFAPIGPGTPSFDVWVPPPGEGGVVCTGYLEGRAFGGPSGRIDYGHLCETSLDIVSPPLQAVFEDGHTGPYDITVEFSQPVAHLVVLPIDIWHCGADPGSITAYAPSGAHVTLPFMADPSDCGVLHDEYGYAYSYGNGTLPQSLFIDGLDSVRRVVITPTNEMSWESTVFYYSGQVLTLEGFVGTTYLLSFREPITTASVTIVRAQGPNPGGSFTSYPGENQLTLQATVAPAEAAPTTQWQVIDDPDDAVTTYEPNGVDPAFGPTVVAIVPPQDASRWASVPHKGTLNQKSLALRVTAGVDASGTIVRSAPAYVRQDEIDTMREEYIELGVGRGVPGRGEFGAHDGNSGDYGLAVVNQAFDGMFFALQLEWQPFTLTMGSLYRNPVHNRYHIGPTGGSGPVSSSWHQYGCAADLPTGLPVFPTQDELAKAQRYWNALHDAAVDVGFTVEARDPDPTKPDNSFSSADHVHVEIKCR